MSFAAAVVPTFPGLSTARSAVSDCAAFASSTPPPSRSVGSSHYAPTTSTAHPCFLLPSLQRGTLLKPVLSLPALRQGVWFSSGKIKWVVGFATTERSQI
jgi:hypothetical protein